MLRLKHIENLSMLTEEFLERKYKELEVKRKLYYKGLDFQSIINNIKKLFNI